MIRTVWMWLKSITDICNDKMGDPYYKCLEKFDEATKSCKEKLGVFDFLCDIVDGTKGLCNISKIGMALCELLRLIKMAVTYIWDKSK